MALGDPTGLEGLSGYFQKKQKPKGPTEAPSIGMPSATPSTPGQFTGGSAAASASPAGAGAGARAPGGKSPTGFVGFERYFSANEPAVRAEAQRVVGQAAGPAGTSTMTMPSQPRVEFAPSLTGGQGTRMTQTSGRTVAKPVQMQRGEARAAQTAVKPLTEPGAYQVSAEESGQTKAQADFNAMLLGGVLPEQAKAEQARLDALQRRLGAEAGANAVASMVGGARAMTEAEIKRLEAQRREDEERRRWEKAQREAQQQGSGYNQEYDSGYEGDY